MRHVMIAGLTLGIFAASATTQASTPRSYLAPMTATQNTTLDRLLAAPAPDRAIAADKTEAMPLIHTMVATGACALVPEAWNSISRMMLKPRTFEGLLPFLVPMMWMDHHDKARCLDVIRIDSWTKPAKNAVRFKVWYVADDSGEAGHLVFDFQKSSDGQWLIRDFGSGLDA